MKYIELQYAFELEASNLDKVLTEKLSSYDIVYWLNQGVSKFIKTRYNGNNSNRTAFEQDEKRTRDLNNLLESVTLTENSITTNKQYHAYTYTYPSNLMFVVDENTTITIQKIDDVESLETEIFECTHDSYMYRITNKLTDFHLRNNYARPLRVMDANGCTLYTEAGKYGIGTYRITYLRKPLPITLDKPFDEYTEFPEYSHNEIVKLAVSMYLESASNPRYESSLNEINTME